MPRHPRSPSPSAPRSVALVTLGCARNEVDSEEMAGRLAAAGWDLVDDASLADVAVVNTCAFVEQAKKDSIDTLLEAADLRGDGSARTRAVVAVGCLAERYGTELADRLPEADGVLGFDAYPDLAVHLDAVLAGRRPPSHTPADRRTRLPIAPVDRAPAARPGPPVVRHRLDGAPWAPIKIASGCDRRCSFCAIPAFRGAFVSRPPGEVLDEAAWLAERGVRELFCVSENSTSYGKDLGDLRALEDLLPRLAAVEGIDRVRVSYLQPAELRDSLVQTLATTPGVAAYFDLSFQHAAPALLRRMRRFGSAEQFADLLERIRALCPAAGIRSNVIVGFPGESEADLAELTTFLEQARLDVVGVFGYSDEEGTEAAGLDGRLPEDVVAERVSAVTDLVAELVAQRAEERLGERVEVLVEAGPDDLHDDVDDDPAGAGEVLAVGRAAHQGPDVDGVTRLVDPAPSGAERPLRPGDLVPARVVATDGVDLVARVTTGGAVW